MATQFGEHRYQIDYSTHHEIALVGGGAFTLKNLGPYTVYLGASQTGSTSPVDSTSGFPVDIGETVQIPRSSTADGFCLGANTANTNHLSYVAIFGVEVV